MDVAGTERMGSAGLACPEFRVVCVSRSLPLHSSVSEQDRLPPRRILGVLAGIAFYRVTGRAELVTLLGPLCTAALVAAAYGRWNEMPENAFGFCVR